MRKKLVFGEETWGLYLLKDNNSISKSAVSTSSKSSLFPKFVFLVPSKLSHLSKSCSRKSFPFVCQSVSSSPVCHEKFNEDINEVISVCNISDIEKVWYNRLGHLSYHAMKNISGIPIRFIDYKNFSCDVCPMARQSKLPFSIISIKYKRYFKLLHIDTWGPIIHQHINGRNIFLP